MLNFQGLLKKTFLINNNNFIHGISFIVISLIAIHIAIFFNFYKFSNDWIVSESEKTTFILSKNINEKVIPDDVTLKIINYLEENQELIKFKILDKDLIQESLGIKNIDDIFGLSLPFVFLIQNSDDQVVDEVYTSVLKISDNRIVEKYPHKDQLFEVVCFLTFFAEVLRSCPVATACPARGRQPKRWKRGWRALRCQRSQSCGGVQR